MIDFLELLLIAVNSVTITEALLLIGLVAVSNIIALIIGKGGNK